NPDALLYLLLLAVTLPTGHSMYQDDVKAWPCPNPEELVPCTCYADEDLNLFVDCQDLPNLETLQDVFDEKFPFKKFFRLQYGVEPSDSVLTWRRDCALSFLEGHTQS
ncbi:putative Oplophorus-luciferin 2-monooxygenase non-catalytic subunit-like 19, partial [Homarus americanus]